MNIQTVLPLCYL